MTLKHVSVLADEVRDFVVPEGAKSFFDGTFGLGGHAMVLLSYYESLRAYFATDLDAKNRTEAISRLDSFRLETGKDFTLKVFPQNFSDVGEIIEKENPERPMGLLFDLGLSSPQIDDGERGFSFVADGELHMGFDSSRNSPAKRLINTASYDELKQIFKEFGEEKNGAKYARVIVEKREIAAIETTGELSELIKKHTHFKDQKKTLMRIFQAIRMAVNEELHHLNKAIKESLRVMKKGDRLGIISYHSLEDRMVKTLFKTATSPITQESERSLHEVIAPADATLITRKPIVPTAAEIEKNPRARSAKLRILQKS
jgi:16S rRNA (cytosine1402-N4)-methyltransferase